LVETAGEVTVVNVIVSDAVAPDTDLKNYNDQEKTSKKLFHQGVT
jgi:hypothetical protein